MTSPKKSPKKKAKKKPPGHTAQVNAICNAALTPPERIVDPIDRMFEWLETLPATNLQATVLLGEEVEEFGKSDWHDLTAFARCCGDRFNGEVTLRRTEPTGKLTIAGLLLHGEWFPLAASQVKKDHGHKYPANSTYVDFNIMYPDCPVYKEEPETP